MHQRLGPKAGAFSFVPRGRVHPSTRFVHGEIVYWRSLASNQEHQGKVLCHYSDPALGERVAVRSKLNYIHIIRAERLQRPRSGAVTLCGPGMLA